MCSLYWRLKTRNRPANRFDAEAVACQDRRRGQGGSLLIPDVIGLTPDDET